ncbi:MAG: hypothetical protein KKH52_00140 [Nanoarchaeota archaeon]|nr:hypothetical protein [Nanoarchaeota archaeon]MBU1623127.1 hypothetical protein [Nanoarchaeota archaeon]MBU1973785.1 hypothetical protein [Nanoarchaeota archaeon]
MDNKKIIVWAEQVSLIALMIIFFKVLVLKPACFDLFDGYFTILPLFITKTLEISQLKNFKK